jgi:hypothetical protein
MLKLKLPNVPKTTEDVLKHFREQYYDTKLFFDPFAGGKFAGYFFDAWENRAKKHTLETVHTLIEEAGLFVEGCHACHSRMSEKTVTA